jgi:putative transposase
MQALTEPQRAAAREIPNAQRRSTRSLAKWLSTCDSREEALFRAHTESGLTMSAIAKELGLSVSRVSRLIARVEGAKGKT